MRARTKIALLGLLLLTIICLLGCVKVIYLGPEDAVKLAKERDALDQDRRECAQLLDECATHLDRLRFMRTGESSYVNRWMLTECSRPCQSIDVD